MCAVYQRGTTGATYIEFPSVAPVTGLAALLSSQNSESSFSMVSVPAWLINGFVLAAATVAVATATAAVAAAAGRIIVLRASGGCQRCLVEHCSSHDVVVL